MNKFWTAELKLVAGGLIILLIGGSIPFFLFTSDPESADTTSVPVSNTVTQTNTDTDPASLNAGNGSSKNQQSKTPIEEQSIPSLPEQTSWKPTSNRSRNALIHRIAYRYVRNRNTLPLLQEIRPSERTEAIKQSLFRVYRVHDQNPFGQPLPASGLQNTRGSRSSHPWLAFYKQIFQNGSFTIETRLIAFRQLIQWVEKTLLSGSETHPILNPNTIPFEHIQKTNGLRSLINILQHTIPAESSALKQEITSFLESSLIHQKQSSVRGSLWFTWLFTEEVPFENWDQLNVQFSSVQSTLQTLQQQSYSPLKSETDLYSNVLSAYRSTGKAKNLVQRGKTHFKKKQWGKLRHVMYVMGLPGWNTNSYQQYFQPFVRRMIDAYRTKNSVSPAFTRTALVYILLRKDRDLYKHIRPLIFHATNLDPSVLRMIVRLFHDTPLVEHLEKNGAGNKLRTMIHANSYGTVNTIGNDSHSRHQSSSNNHNKKLNLPNDSPYMSERQGKQWLTAVLEDPSEKNHIRRKQALQIGYDAYPLQTNQVFARLFPSLPDLSLREGLRHISANGYYHVFETLYTSYGKKLPSVFSAYIHNLYQPARFRTSLKQRIQRLQHIKSSLSELPGEQQSDWKPSNNIVSDDVPPPHKQWLHSISEWQKWILWALRSYSKQTRTPRFLKAYLLTTNDIRQLIGVSKQQKTAPFQLPSAYYEERRASWNTLLYLAQEMSSSESSKEDWSVDREQLGEKQTTQNAPPYKKWLRQTRKKIENNRDEPFNFSSSSENNMFRNTVWTFQTPDGTSHRTKLDLIRVNDRWKVFRVRSIHQ